MQFEHAVLGVIGALCLLMFSGCSTYGGEIRCGWVPVNSVEVTQSLIQEGEKKK